MAHEIFAHRNEIEVARSPEAIFSRIGDVDSLLRRLARRAPMEIARIRGEGPPAVGDAWRIVGEWKGFRRESVARIARVEAPTTLVLVTKSSGYKAETTLAIRPDAAGGASLVTIQTRAFASGLRAFAARSYVALRSHKIEALAQRGARRLKKWLEAS